VLARRYLSRATVSRQRRTRAGRHAHKAQAPAVDGLAALRASARIVLMLAAPV
jgi:hypothetical protein